MNMVWSKQNFIFTKNNLYYLYNFNSNVLLKLLKDDFLKLLEVKNKPDYQLENLKQKEEFIKYKIFVKSNSKEIEIYKENVIQSRKTDDVFDVFIYPTLGCNLKCPYCFQLSYNKNTMNLNTIKNTIRFVSSIINENKTSKVRITWMGGEPLLFVDKINSILDGISKSILNYNNIDFNNLIITNGILLDDKAIHMLYNFHIYKLQITIDGLFEDHDKKRPSKNGLATFDRILKNVEKVLNFNEKFSVLLRVNIDKNNKNNFVKIYNYLFKRFERNIERVIIYPGYIDDYSYTCKSTSENINSNLSRKERSEFVLDLANNKSIIIQDFLPKKNFNSCMARAKNSYAIGPNGYIYKCTSAVGEKNFSIGNVNDDDYFTNKTMLNEFLFTEDYLDSKKCNDCNLFMVCDGGCPLLRLKKKWYSKHIDTCHLAKDYIDKFILTHLELKTKTTNNKTNNNIII